MKILLFGIAKDIVGQQFLDLVPSRDLETVADLKKYLLEQYPAFKELNSFAVAIDEEYSEDEALINSAGEIAILPPVSGG